MVVWVFVGGGDSEIKGLIPFLQDQYKGHRFVRKSPARLKPGPRPPKGRGQDRFRRAGQGHGRTGKSLAEQIVVLLTRAFWGKEFCDLILVIDDLDCHDPGSRRKLFRNAISGVEAAARIQRYVGFASPEVESWIVADWGNTIARDADFKEKHQAMRHWLSTERSVPFDRPEEFSSLDPVKNSCRDKLSDAIIKATIECNARALFSKGTHTPRFLKQISPEVVSGKCPLFRELHNHLSRLE